MNASPTMNTSRRFYFGWRNLNLRTKLITVLLLAALIPIVIIVYINNRNSTENLTNAANEKLLNASLLVSNEIDLFMLDNLNIVRAEAQLPAIVEYANLPASQRKGSPEELRVTTFLVAVARQNPVYLNSAAVIDIKGTTLADTNTSSIGLDRSDRYYFINVLESNLPYASTLEYDTVTGNASIYFAAPIRNRAGKVIGVFRKRFDAAILQSFVSNSTGLAGDESFAVLLDENNVRIGHGTNRDIIHKSVVPMDAATLATLQEQRFMPPGTSEELSTNIPEFKAGLDNYKNNPFFAAELDLGGGEIEEVAVTQMETQPWLVVFAQPREVFLAPINEQVQVDIITALLIAVVVAFFGVFISQTLSGPIVRLTQTAEAIAGGDINIQAKIETGDEIGTLADTFNRMTQQLRDFIAGLEERVAARTKDLATVAEVGTATSTILETDKLLNEVVELTKERFSLYHSHIYLMDEQGENLLLTAGAGEPGRVMVSEKRSIPLSREQSLVARAARERKGVTINDVTQAPDFLANPLLPNTRSEMAVPMLVGQTLIGVFDIQSDQVGRFTDSDISIQTTLAAQLASSVQNARSYERSKSQADFESLVNTIGQKIQRTTSVEDTLQTAIREIGLALGASRVSANIESGRQDNSKTLGIN